MSKISGLRAIISNGWTRKTRQLFINKLGNDNFDLLQKIYQEARAEIPFVPKGSTNGRDVFLSFGLSPAAIDNVLDQFPAFFSGKIKSGVPKALENLFPKFKNEEINIENIGHKFTNIKCENIEKVMFERMGINFQRQSYKISDLVKLKNVGNSAKLKCSPDFSTEIVTDNKEFSTEIYKLFNKSSDKMNDYLSASNVNRQNYIIKQKGKSIGYFSIETVDDALSVGNYVVYPEYRNSKTSLNAILAVRDRVINQAAEKGINKIISDVDVNNPKLLGLYQRFGFKPNSRETYSFVDDLGKQHKEDFYTLVGYVN